MRWVELLRRLGQALGDLLAAELSELVDDLRKSRQELVKALAQLAIAAALLLLAGAVLTIALIFGLVRAFDWHPWLAALVVALAYAACGAAFALAGRARLRRTEMPAETVRRRWNDQTEWFRNNVVGPPAGAFEAVELESGVEPDE